MDGFSVWAKPTLTEEEAEGAALYRTVLPDGRVMPGILPRIYPFQFVRTTFAGEQSVLSIRYVTSGLRSLLHAITWSGDIEFWQVSCKTLSGEILFENAPVTSLLNLPKMNGAITPTDAGLPGTDSTWPIIPLRPAGLPLVYDPPWCLDGTQALQMDAAPLADSGAEAGNATYVSTNPESPSRGVLNVAFHVREIPGAQGNRGPTPPPARMPMRPPIAPIRGRR